MGVNFSNTEIAFERCGRWDLQRAYWLFRLLQYPRLTRFLTVAANVSLQLRLPVEWFIKKTVFAQFCGGETIRECRHTMERLGRRRVGTILDFAAEGVADERALDATMEEVLRTVELAHREVHIPFCVFKPTGVARFSLLEKRPEQRTPAEQGEWDRVVARFDRICSTAAERNVPVFIDAEESWIQDNCDVLATEMMRRHNRDRAIVYNTLQMYRVDRMEVLRRALEQARNEGYRLAFKVVRGAYLEKERARAQELEYPSPLCPDKESTDRNFDEAIAFCLKHSREISLCAGTHNELSCERLVRGMAEHGIAPDDPRVFFSQLLGMSDHITYNLAAAGYQVGKYVPYGPVRTMMPYLSRRAKENSSVTGQSGRELALLENERRRRKGRSLARYTGEFVPT